MSTLPHLARQFDLMVKGARRLDLSCEDDFEELRCAAIDGSITAEQIVGLIDYDYQTGQDPRAGATTLIAALLRDALTHEQKAPEKRCVHGTPESQVCGMCCGYK